MDRPKKPDYFNRAGLKGSWAEITEDYADRMEKYADQREAQIEDLKEITQRLIVLCGEIDSLEKMEKVEEIEKEIEEKYECS